MVSPNWFNSNRWLFNIILLVLLMTVVFFVHLTIMYLINGEQSKFFQPYSTWWGWLLGGLSWLFSSFTVFFLVYFRPMTALNSSSIDAGSRLAQTVSSSMSMAEPQQIELANNIQLPTPLTQQQQFEQMLRIPGLD